MNRQFMAHVCGSPGIVHRVKGWRLPRGLAPYIGKPYSDLPTPLLLAYMQWFTGPNRWIGHVFELWELQDELERRDDIEGWS